MNKLKIAVLITCFNRKDKSLICLRLLKNSINENKIEAQFEIYLVDDGSTDGTSEAVSSLFPEVKVIKGKGNLFWAGGMRLAWNTALKSIHDYYLLLNDDTFLFENAINQLLGNSIKYYKQSSKHAIFIGSTTNVEMNKITYGGRKLFSTKKPKGYLIKNKKELVECDLGNGNIMFVPNIVVKNIGIISNDYTHVSADYDYTLRAKKGGIKTLVIPGVLGICEDDHGKGWLTGEVSLKERIKYLYSPKGLAYKEYLSYIKTHFPTHLPEAIFKLWLKTLCPFVYDRFKKEIKD